MINILHSIDTPGPGGAETVYFDIVTGLDRSRFNSFPVIPAKGWLFDRLQDKGFNPLIIDSKGSFNLAYLLRLIQVIRTQNIDLIHSHLFGSNVYCSLAGMLTATPVISTFHGFVDATGAGKTARGKFTIINKGSRKITFVSKQLKQYFIENHNISEPKAEVIYNGIDTDKFTPGENNRIRELLGFEEDDIIVGAVGNIRKAKGYDLLLLAAAEIKKQRQDIKFVIAGQGGGKLYQELIALQDKLELKNTVFFLGFSEDTTKILHGINIFLLCSISEGFSLSLIEAMACGLPVISTKCGGPEEIICSDQDGLLLNDSSPKSVAHAIITLASSLDREIDNAKIVPPTIENKFSKSKMIYRHSQLYENIVTYK